MNRSAVAIAISTALMLGSGVAVAQKGHGPKPGKSHPAQGAQAHGPKSAAHGPKATTHGPKSTAHGPKSTPHGPKSAAHGPKATTSSTAKGKATAHGRGPKSAPATTTAAAPKGNPHAAAATTTGTSLTLTPVQQKLQRNTNLASRLEARLPAGTNLMTAADGFRNLGQFVAAVNVSSNLDIPFATLKSRMVDDGLSLGQAIQSVRRDVDFATEVRRAEADANRIIVDTDRTVARPKGKKSGGGN